jgi:hypothetical protein
MRFLIVFIRIPSRLTHDGLNMNPVAAGIDDHQFVSALDRTQFRSVCTRRYPDTFFVDKRSTLRLSVSKRWNEKQDSGKQHESLFHMQIIGPISVAGQYLNFERQFQGDDVDA